LSTTWIMVCDAAKARLFETRSRAVPWTVLETTLHAESRSKGSELVSDHSGSRASQGASAHHDALAPSSAPKEVTKAHFAHTLVKTLEQARCEGRFDSWIAVAPPHFLGSLRSELTVELGKLLVATLDKDLSQLSRGEIEDRLHDMIPVPLGEPPLLEESRSHWG